MKKALLLISVLLVLLLGACKVTVPPGLFTDFSETASPTEEPAETEAPTPSHPSSEPEESTEVSLPPLPSETSEQSSGFLGKLEGDTYTNEALGFSVTIPHDWKLESEEDMATLFGMSADYMEDVTGLQSNTQMYFFYCSKYGAENQNLNPNINMGISNQAETMMVMESEENFNMFLEQYKPLLESMYGGAEVSLTSDRGITINDKEYSIIHISTEINDIHIWQDQYYTPLDDYVLIITTTYFSGEDEGIIAAFMNSMKYEG